MNDVERAESVNLEVGVKHQHVIINSYGNRDVPPSWTALTPTEARQLAEHILRCAESIESAS